MIKIDGIYCPRKLIANAYKMSRPVGMGFLQYREGDLPEDPAVPGFSHGPATPDHGHPLSGGGDQRDPRERLRRPGGGDSQRLRGRARSMSPRRSAIEGRRACRIW